MNNDDIETAFRNAQPHFMAARNALLRQRPAPSRTVRYPYPVSQSRITIATFSGRDIVKQVAPPVPSGACPDPIVGSKLFWLRDNIMDSSANPAVSGSQMYYWSEGAFGDGLCNIPADNFYIYPSTLFNNKPIYRASAANGHSAIEGAPDPVPGHVTEPPFYYDAFSGLDGYNTCGPNVYPSNLQTWTIVGVMKPELAAPDHGPVFFTSGNSTFAPFTNGAFSPYLISVGFDPSGHLIVKKCISGGTTTYTTNQTFSYSQYHELVIIVNSSVWSVYVDGSAVTWSGSAPGAVPDSGHPHNFAMGILAFFDQNIGAGNYDDPTCWFHSPGSQLAEIAMYDKAITPTERASYDAYVLCRYNI